MESKSVAQLLAQIRGSPFPVVILGLTGSVASIKAAELTKSLLEDARVNVIIAQTKSSQHFTRNCKDPAWLLCLE